MKPPSLHPLPPLSSLRALLPEPVVEFAGWVADEGGQALLVGGFVRDLLLGQVTKDLDVEVFGLGLDQVQTLLSRLGETSEVGRAFGVLRVHGLDVDFSLPRRDSKIGRGHRGIAASTDPNLDFPSASRRRDLTVNSMAVDLATGELLDPHGGCADLRAGMLRATDPASFGEDPLRAVRVAQLSARLRMDPDAQLYRICARQDLSELSGERVFEELRKLLLQGLEPSRGLRFLEQTSLLRFFPELGAMVDVPQDPLWHPEGDVWVHTLMVVDEAVLLRARPPHTDDDLALMFGALLHDVGKPATTTQGEDGRIRSPQHDVEGVGPARRFLGRLHASNHLTQQVCALVQYHLAPANFLKGKASAKAYRRLARKLQSAGVSMELLERVARADHFGRTTLDAQRRQFEAGDRFLERARDLHVQRRGPRDVVLGRHLIQRGFEPGPEMGAVLARCREVQDETGWTEADQILERVLGRRDR